jgi:integrase
MGEKRGTRGEGSVYQRKDGRWVGKYVDGNTGKTRYVYGKSKSDARAKLKQAMADSAEGITGDTSAFGDYLDRWLSSTRDTVGLRTHQRAQSVVALHIKPTLGKVKLCKLTAMHLDSLYRDKLKSGLSPRSVQIIHATAHKALKQAVRWRMVRTNVAEHATPPKSSRRDMLVLTVEQSQILLRTAERKQPHLYALYVLAVTTGARLGELLALQRGDVDLTAGTLRISKSVHNGRVTAPKTSAARRTIRLSRTALDALDDHISLYAGDAWLFPSLVNDMSIHRSTLHISYWKPLLKAAGLPQETRFHDLRHAAASIMLGNNVPLPVVSHVLGHANPAITGTVYAHMLDNMSGYGAEAMDAALG